MRRRFFATICTAALLATPQFTSAQETTAPQNYPGHDHAAHQHVAETTTGPHGGTVQTVGEHRVETVVVDKGIMFKAVYICCAGCAKKLHAQPDEFLAKLNKMGVKPPAMQ